MQALQEITKREELDDHSRQDVTNAAILLGKAMGVPEDTLLQQTSFTEASRFVSDAAKLADVKEPNKSVPEGHDCTICPVVSCSLLDLARNNSIFAKRIQAIQELKLSNPDFLQGDNPEQLIKAKMESHTTNPNTDTIISVRSASELPTTIFKSTKVDHVNSATTEQPTIALKVPDHIARLQRTHTKSQPTETKPVSRQQTETPTATYTTEIASSAIETKLAPVVEHNTGAAAKVSEQVKPTIVDQDAPKISEVQASKIVETPVQKTQPILEIITVKSPDLINRTISVEPRIQTVTPTEATPQPTVQTSRESAPPPRVESNPSRIQKHSSTEKVTAQESKTILTSETNDTFSHDFDFSLQTAKPVTEKSTEASKRLETKRTAGEPVTENKISKIKQTAEQPKIIVPILEPTDVIENPGEQTITDTEMKNPQLQTIEKQHIIVENSGVETTTAVPQIVKTENIKTPIETFITKPSEEIKSIIESVQTEQSNEKPPIASIEALVAAIQNEITEPVEKIEEPSLQPTIDHKLVVLHKDKPEQVLMTRELATTIYFPIPENIQTSISATETATEKIVEQTFSVSETIFAQVQEILSHIQSAQTSVENQANSSPIVLETATQRLIIPQQFISELLPLLQQKQLKRTEVKEKNINKTVEKFTQDAEIVETEQPRQKVQQNYIDHITLQWFLSVMANTFSGFHKKERKAS